MNLKIKPTPKNNKPSRAIRSTKINQRDSGLRQNDKESSNKLAMKPWSNVTMRTKVLFILGSLFLVTSVGWHVNQTIQLMFFTPKVTPVAKVYPIPTEITIPKVEINLPIEETAINRGVWQISEKGASHLTISARPGEKGAIIMYSHNTNERFGPIRWLSIGDNIEIKTADGKNHVYKITQTMTVSPNKMDIFTQQKGETLIIYTCDGFADLQRFVLIAKPQ